MPLASVANLALVMGLDEEKSKKDAGHWLRSGGWVSSVMRGMTERRQHRFFLTSQVRGPALHHRPPAPQRPGRKPTPPGLAAFHPQGELPQNFQERFALDHDHPVHLENQGELSLRRR